ncbi:hypothetical protein ACFLXY_00290 [Chloroflexota bacterium]
MRPHTEKIKPPRALWVPFELGHPLGAPDNPEFQRRVLMDLINLLERPSGPVLEDFPDDEPESGEEIILACPVNYSDYYKEIGEADGRLKALNMEISGMRSWYDMAVNQRKRTTMGVSGIEIEKLGDFIYSFVKGEEPDNPRDDISLPYTLKLAVEDLKSYYVEGITAQPGQSGVSSQKISDWFWDETVAGKVLLDLKKVCEKSEDRMMAMMGSHFIVPGDVARKNQD